MTTLHDKLGEKIRFIKGKYQGQQGWLHKEKGTTTKMAWVIVEQNAIMKEARVMKTSIIKIFSAGPLGPAEAILFHHVDIQSKIIELCKLMAACHVQIDQTSDFAHHFHCELYRTLQEHQADPKAKYFAKLEPNIGNKKPRSEERKTD